mgnify:CR=1 FL=1
MRFNEFVGFRLNCKVRAVLDNVEYHPFHMHKDIIEAILLLDGSATVTDCAADHMLTAGDVYIFNALDPHRITSERDNIILTVHIERSYYSSMFNELEEKHFTCDSYTRRNRYPNEFYHLRFLLASIWQEYSGEVPSELAAGQLGGEFLQLLYDRYRDYYYVENGRNGYEIRSLDAKETSDDYFDKFYPILDYIYDNCSKKISLEEIAEKEYLSPSYLSRYIKKTFGLGFSQILSLARCEEAERLLSGTEKNLEEIAREAGFANRNHLSANFMRWYSKTPAQFRKSIRDDLDREIIYRPFDKKKARRILEGYLDGH